jgi:large subunit ribosomal protein L35
MTAKQKPKKTKLKTYKAAAKRFKVTGTGKIMRTKGGKSHLRRNSSKRVKAKFDKGIEVTCKGDKKRIMKMAPYLKLYKANPPA